MAIVNQPSSMEANEFPYIPSKLDNLKLTPVEFRIFCNVCRRAGRDGVCWTSTVTIAEDCLVNRKTVIKTLAILVANNLLTSQERSGRTTTYRITESSLWNQAIYRPKSKRQKNPNFSHRKGNPFQRNTQVSDWNGSCSSIATDPGTPLERHPSQTDTPHPGTPLERHPGTPLEHEGIPLKDIPRRLSQEGEPKPPHSKKGGKETELSPFRQLPLEIQLGQLVDAYNLKFKGKGVKKCRSLSGELKVFAGVQLKHYADCFHEIFKFVAENRELTNFAQIDLEGLLIEMDRIAQHMLKKGMIGAMQIQLPKRDELMHQIEVDEKQPTETKT